MNHLIRAEWIKFRSVRSTVVTLLLAAAIVVLVAVLAAANARDDTTTRCEATPVTSTAGSVTVVSDSPQCGTGSALVTRPSPTHLTSLTMGVTFAALIFGVLGVQIIGQEYRFNTIRPTFTAAPVRIRVLAAKAVVLSVACAVTAAVMVAFCWAVGTVMLEGFTVDGIDRRAAGGIVLFGVLWALAGMGVGAIVRQPIAGILIMAAESLIVEGLVAALVDSSARWLPFSNGVQMTLRPATDPSTQLQSVLAGGIYFAVVCALLWAVGAVLVHRRDA